MSKKGEEGGKGGKRYEEKAEAEVAVAEAEEEVTAAEVEEAEEEAAEEVDTCVRCMAATQQKIREHAKA